MEIHIDYNPSPKDHFFISVPLNKKECISFDRTIKGKRVMKQVFKEKIPFPAGIKFNSEWDTIVIKNGSFNNKFHVRWVDMNKKDWLNGEIWETVKEKSLEDDTSNRLLYYSRLISDNYDNLSEYKNEIMNFEKLIQNKIDKFA